MIEIIHTNDIHSHIENFAKISNIVKKVRARNKNCLLIDAGDMITGEFQFKYLQGQAEQTIINLLNYDLLTVGNHEFDLGVDFLSEYMEKINSLYIISNMLDIENQIGEYQAYLIKEIDGVKIAFISILFPVVADILSHQGITDIEFISQEYYANIVENVKNLGADFVIAVNHQGIDLDIKLAEMNLDIDLIIGAHSHTKLDEPLEINGTKIVQTGSFAQNLGMIRFDYQNKQITNFSYRLIDLNQYEEIDQEVQEIVDRANKQLVDLTNNVIASCSHDLEGRREVMIRQSTNLGTLICDSYLKRANKHGYDADFALVNSRGLRQTIKAGPITIKELYNVMPFGKQLLVCDIKGQDLLPVLNSRVEFQTSNLGIINKNNQKYFYEQDLKSPIDLHKTYRLVTIDYLYEHELFPSFKNAKLIADNIGNDLEVVSDFLKDLEPDFQYRSNNMVNTID